MFDTFVSMLLRSASIYLIGFGVLLAIEIFFRREDVPVMVRARGLLFWSVLLPIDIAVAVVFISGREALGVAPYLSFKSTFGSAIVAAAVATLWTDFIFYWFHRIQHRFLWRWHAVHHSIENLSAINSYHHWSEPIWYTLIVSVPLAFVNIHVLAPALLIVYVFKAWPFFIHSPVTLHVGPLRHILVDNRYHRIHHSVERAHHDKNFGAITPLWDWLFGTMYMPRPDEWPATGVSGLPEPKSLREWSSAPGRRLAPAVATMSPAPNG